MDKQKVIKSIEDEKILNCTSIEDENYNYGLRTALDYVKLLDEPEKPIVPQFVADWYEDNKREFENQIYFLCINFNDDALSEDLHDWFVNPENEPIQTLVRMKFYDYEVEKEKLYEVFLKDIGVRLGVITPDYKDKYQFTDEELKEYGFDNSDKYEVKEVEE